MRKLHIFLLGVFTSISLLSFTITPVLAQTNQTQTAPQITQGLCAGVNLSVSDTNCSDTTSQTNQKIDQIVHSIINLLSVVVGIVAVIMIIVGGLRYITSGGSDTSITGAKNTILYAVIGLVIVAMAQIIVRFVLSKLTQ